ncbi:hypothetical protein [Rossellomorea marisflavi]|uniref:hypothetical protein n=1 Tax=Rossellomorea marisflavi TaxID=189381 RepID=UPI003459B389
MKKLILVSALLILLSGCSLDVFGNAKADELVEFNNEKLNEIVKMEEEATKPIIEAANGYDLDVLIEAVEGAKPEYDKMVKEIDSWEFDTDEIQAKVKELREIVVMTRDNLDVQVEAFKTEDDAKLKEAEDNQMEIEKKAEKFDKDLNKLADEWDVEITDQELESES